MAVCWRSRCDGGVVLAGKSFGIEHSSSRAGSGVHLGGGVGEEGVVVDETCHDVPTTGLRFDVSFVYVIMCGDDVNWFSKVDPFRCQAVEMLGDKCPWSGEVFADDIQIYHCIGDFAGKLCVGIEDPVEELGETAEGFVGELTF